MKKLGEKTRVFERTKRTPGQSEQCPGKKERGESILRSEPPGKKKKKGGVFFGRDFSKKKFGNGKKKGGAQGGSKKKGSETR